MMEIELLSPSKYEFLNKPEQAVANWLDKHGIPFTVQDPIAGGTMELGGMVVDFRLTMSRIIIRVMGVYWHQGLEASGRDIMGEEVLRAKGYIVVDLWEDDINTRLDYVMRLAVQGVEIPR